MNHKIKTPPNITRLKRIAKKLNPFFELLENTRLKDDISPTLSIWYARMFSYLPNSDKQIREFAFSELEKFVHTRLNPIGILKRNIAYCEDELLKMQIISSIESPMLLFRLFDSFDLRSQFELLGAFSNKILELTSNPSELRDISQSFSMVAQCFEYSIILESDNIKPLKKRMLELLSFDNSSILVSDSLSRYIYIFENFKPEFNSEDLIVFPYLDVVLDHISNKKLTDSLFQILKIRDLLFQFGIDHKPIDVVLFSLGYTDVPQTIN